MNFPLFRYHLDVDDDVHCTRRNRKINVQRRVFASNFISLGRMQEVASEQASVKMLNLCYNFMYVGWMEINI